VAEWLGKGLQNLLQQFESARNLRIAKAIYRFGDLFSPTTNLRDKTDMKYFKWVGICSALVTIVGCYLPWIEIVSIPKTVTGLDPAGTNFGSPGKVQIFFDVLAIILFMIPRIWARRTNLFLAAFAISWAFRNIIIYSRCEMGECPQRGLGIWMVMIGSVLVLVSAIFQDLRLKPDSVAKTQ
jgi:hypothetical protein